MTTSLPPGAWHPSKDLYGTFEKLSARLPARALVLVDKRVAALHPKLRTSIDTRAPLDVLELRAGEQVKTLKTLQRVAESAHALKRDGTLVCVGGGTLGDLATVAAHLIKRGVKLIHVPTTLLAAVDSSHGGKGAVHAGGVKNALGVFHTAEETWICEEVFATLSRKQHREGITEAWKMAVCLDGALFERWKKKTPTLHELVRDSRRMKEAVVEKDPYDDVGIRRVLNFGHTFGHVLESLSRFRISHGDAVGLGMLCALDVGRAMGVTPGPVATMVEESLKRHVGILSREVMAKVFSRSEDDAIAHALLADKKGADAARVKMVLLAAPGKTTSTDVATKTWTKLLRAWRGGTRP